MHPPNLGFDGRVVLITGSTRGIGRALAMGFGNLGAKVAMNYMHNAARGAEAFAEFQDTGNAGVLVRGSIVDPTQVDRIVDEVEHALGPVDILVVNATPPQPLSPIENSTWAEYQTMLDFFVKSPFLLTRRVLPAMKARRRGRIVNIGTELLARGVSSTSAYATAKAGQHGWTRSMALELAPHGITVNTVSPGWIPVERHATTPERVKQAYLEEVPMGRWGVPQDLVGTVSFLASDAAAFVTGQNIYVDGGRLVG